MKAFVVVFMLLAFFIGGTVFGYRTGVHNQLYYDAPAKIKIYSNVIDRREAENYLNGQIVSQIRILNESDYLGYHNRLLLNIPPHGRDFIDAFEQYWPSIKTNHHYKSKLVILCSQNDESKEHCE